MRSINVRAEQVLEVSLTVLPEDITDNPLCLWGAIEECFAVTPKAKQRKVEVNFRKLSPEDKKLFEGSGCVTAPVSCRRPHVSGPLVCCLGRGHPATASRAHMAHRPWLVPFVLICCSQLLVSHANSYPEGLLLWTPPSIKIADDDEHRLLLLGLALAGRRQWRMLGPALLAAWGSSAPPFCPSQLWGRPLPAVRWRCRRVHWIARRPHLTWRRRLRRRCGYAGIRVGEAAHPGPGTPVGGARAPMAVDGGPPDRERSPPALRRDGRVLRPVPNCPAGAPGSRVWTSHAALRPHLEDHAAGTLDGEVPAAYRAQHQLDLCSVCGGLVASRFRGAHPRCRPAARQAAAPAAVAGNLASGPDLNTVFADRIPVLRHVPKAARSAWAQCLARALGQVAATNSLQAWRDYFMLPKAVLRPAPRGGHRHRLQAAQFTQRRCARWLKKLP
eukprot:s521_g22.t1